MQKANIDCEESERNMWRERQNVAGADGSMPAPEVRRIGTVPVNKANAGT